MPEMRRLDFIKGSDRFIISYEVGAELLAYDAIMKMVDSGQIDCYDGAILSHQLWYHGVKGLKVFSPKP